MADTTKPLVAILMGSQSDWEVMQEAVKQLTELGIPNEARVISAHRATDALMDYVVAAPGRGIEVFIAGAGMAAHLPGVISAKTDLPVLGVPLKGGLLDGMDALLAIVQMPGGVPVATFAVGKAGAVGGLDPWSQVSGDQSGLPEIARRTDGQGDGEHDSRREVVAG